MAAQRSAVRAGGGSETALERAREGGLRAVADLRRTAAAVTLPTEVVLFVDGQQIHREVRSEQRANVPLDEALFRVPEPTPPLDERLARRGRAMHQWHEEFVSAGVPLDGLQDQVQADEIAPGVFHLTGGTHDSLAVVQEQGIVLAEAPLYPERSEATLAFLRAKFPRLSITHVISSHHHTDHSAGLRTFVALGAEVVLGQDSAHFFRSDIFRGPSEIIPDRLSERSVRPRLRTVPRLSSVTLADRDRPLVAQHVRSSHANDMLITYLPRQKLLFVSDVYSPQGPFNRLWAEELRAALRELELDVAFIAGAHGAGLATVEDLDRALASEP